MTLEAISETESIENVWIGNDENQIGIWNGREVKFLDEKDTRVVFFSIKQRKTDLNPNKALFIFVLMNPQQARQEALVYLELLIARDIHPLM